MDNYWKGKRVLVTGGTGFIGSHLVDLLLEKEVQVTVTTYKQKNDLKNIQHVKNRIRIIQGDLTQRSFSLAATKDQDVVMNLAARVAGVKMNSTRPATMFRDNLSIFSPVLDAARINNVDRFLTVSSACVYPRECTIPIPENEGFKDAPDPANEGYGWAKRMEEYISSAYKKEFGMRIAIARPFNTYGPRDTFNVETGHVISSLIVRIMRGDKPLIVWGDGKQSRSFIYCKDFARGLMEITEKYPEADPINLGSDEEITIEDLAELIIHISGKKTKLKFDETKPSGQPRRSCDTNKAQKLIGFKTEIPLEQGLKETIQWYQNQITKG